MAKKSWDYAEQSRETKEAGGCEAFQQMLIDKGFQSGLHEGRKEAAWVFCVCDFIIFIAYLLIKPYIIRGCKKIKEKVITILNRKKV